MTTNCLDRKLINNTANLLPFLKIISDGNRLKILCLLKGGERCVCDLYENLDLAQNLVSSHLKILKDFGLIEVRQEGKKNYYRINLKSFKVHNLLLVNFFKNYE
jgi:ArsR family transcriptional regulator